MSDSSHPSAVIKVGGSLLDWPDLPGRLSSFLKSEPDFRSRSLLIAGGGRSVDVIRDLDSVHRFGEIDAHVLAIRALDLTARILGRLLPGSSVIDDVAELPMCRDAGLIPILAPSRFLREHESEPGPRLPATWDVTSDAIAAWIAGRLHAGRLILLKSVDIPMGSTRSRAAALGLVDPIFPAVAHSLKRVDYRNLRNLAGPLVNLPESA